MILRDKRVLFFHVGKAAGTSVERWLDPRCPTDPIHISKTKMEEFCFGWSEKYNCFLQHLTPQSMRELGFISWTQFRKYYKFVVVRNPIERLFSVFLYNPRYHQKYKTFDLFCQNLSEEYGRRIKFGDHLSRQYDYATISDTQVAEIYFFERLDQMVDRVGTLLDISDPLPHFNKTQNETTPFVLKLSSKGLSQIHTVYEKDFEVFYPNLDGSRYLSV